jgi:hypothetical protein
MINCLSVALIFLDSLIDLIITCELCSSDIYFIGGFGTVAWIDVNEYEALQPDKIAMDGGEHNLKVS